MIIGKAIKVVATISVYSMVGAIVTIGSDPAWVSDMLLGAFALSAATLIVAMIWKA